MSSGKRILSLLVVAALWMSSLPLFSFAASPDDTDKSEAAGIILPAGLSGMEGISEHGAPAAMAQVDNESVTPVGYSDNENRDYGGFVLRADKLFVLPGESVEITASFDNSVKSNTAILGFSYNPEIFDFEGFEPANGIELLTGLDGEDTQRAKGELKLIFMIGRESVSNLGSLSLRAKDDEGIYGVGCTVSSSVTYVNGEGDDKVTLEESSKADILPAILGDINLDKMIDVMDLSEFVDYFGLDDSSDEWAPARWFDFDRNGSIDIRDIVIVGRIIVDSF